MFTRWIALALAGVCHAALAQTSERVYSDECGLALDALEAQEAAAASAPGTTPRPAARSGLQALQRKAASACLGGARGESTGAPRSSVVQTPITVPPVTVVPRPAPPPVRLPPIPTPPPTITVCDVNGCMASDGTRLNRVGPDLMGPRGLCTVQGATLLCPNP